MTNSRPLLYVGNIAYTATDNDIVKLFAPRRVANVRIVYDRFTGRPRGFAFAEMATEEDALDAIRKLHGTKFGERTIVVRAANERKRFDEARW